MRLDFAIKQLIKKAVNEVIEEEIQNGRLQLCNPPEPSEQDVAETFPKERDSNSIIRPTELAEMLSVSKTTLWRWEQNQQLPARINLSGRSVGWRYGDIANWLSKR